MVREVGKAEDTRDEINRITAILIELGLSDDQKFAILTETGLNRKEVNFDKSVNFSVILKNIPYLDTYKELKRKRDYNVALVDGALLQLQYTFENDIVIKHRLAFFPSPDLTEYQNDPEIYELDQMFAEILERNIVTTPLRFDFDRDSFNEEDHPMAHLTIGQYKNCRVPMESAVSPFRFFEFVLGSFYNTAYRNYRAEIPGPSILHPVSITAIEKRRIHIGLESEF